MDIRLIIYGSYGSLNFNKGWEQNSFFFVLEVARTWLYNVETLLIVGGGKVKGLHLYTVTWASIPSPVRDIPVNLKYELENMLMFSFVGI